MTSFSEGKTSIYGITAKEPIHGDFNLIMKISVFDSLIQKLKRGSWIVSKTFFSNDTACYECDQLNMLPLLISLFETDSKTFCNANSYIYIFIIKRIIVYYHFGSFLL